MNSEPKTASFRVPATVRVTLASPFEIVILSPISRPLSLKKFPVTITVPASTEVIALSSLSKNTVTGYLRNRFYGFLKSSDRILSHGHYLIVT